MTNTSAATTPPPATGGPIAYTTFDKPKSIVKTGSENRHTTAFLYAPDRTPFMHHAHLVEHPVAGEPEGGLAVDERGGGFGKGLTGCCIGLLPPGVEVHGPVDVARLIGQNIDAAERALDLRDVVAGPGDLLDAVEGEGGGLPGGGEPCS